MMSKQGFTLIELLVVISIIAVLAGLLLPAVRMVKASSLQGTCGSNMRQLNASIEAYGVDNEGAIPPQAYVTGEQAGLDIYFDQNSKSGSGSTAANYLASPASKCPVIRTMYFSQIVSNAPSQGNSSILTALGSSVSGLSKPYMQYRINFFLGGDGPSGGNSLPKAADNPPIPWSASANIMTKARIKANAAVLFCGQADWTSWGVGPSPYRNQNTPQFPHSGNAVLSGTSGFTGQSAIAVVEDGKTNISFLDGHVEARSGIYNTTASGFSDKQVPVKYIKPTAGTTSPVCDFWGVTY